jgi:hypothetical protein
MVAGRFRLFIMELRAGRPRRNLLLLNVNKEHGHVVRFEQTLT